MSLTSGIDRHYFPVASPAGPLRCEFSWKLFINGKCVARSSDYFPTEEAAEIALDEFLAAAPDADVKFIGREPGTTSPPPGEK